MSTDREKQTGANTAGQSELIETLGATCGECGSDMEIVRPGKWQCPKCELEEMIQQAHRQGWEQAKREAVGITDKIGFAAHSRTDAQNCCAEIADAIASMEYKEAKDENI